MNRIIELSRAAVELVNPLNKANSTVGDILIPSKFAKQIVQVASQISNKGLVVGNIGEISVRIPGTLEKFAINILDSSMGNLSENDLCLIDITNGRIISSKSPAKHYEWHRRFYSETTAGSVVLCQPPAALICGSSNICPASSLWPDIRYISDQLTCVANDIQEISSKSKTHQFLLIQGVGLLVTGSTLKDAFWNAEIIERFCQISIRFQEEK